jgi:hypothetical protein
VRSSRSQGSQCKQGGGATARGRPATVLAATLDDSQCQVGAGLFLAGCREEGALRRGRAATLLRYLEVVEFSPTEELGRTMEVVTKNMEEMESASS